MKVIDSLLYTAEHEWVKVENDTAIVGITDFAQDQLGTLVFVELPSVGDNVTKGESFCVVESTKAASDVYAPVSGEVLETNSALEDDPELINKDPYGKGWIAKLGNISKEELNSLLTAEKYKELISNQ
ncbi:MAG: glycine cleavage system protein GcvH [Candidatus Dadabacteria bacterium]|nr:MAG: glycine cleavage system protein GcvH [Candidatus Dadabacteria bacterium]